MTAVQTPAERLARSRELLRQALGGAPAGAQEHPPNPSGAGAPWWNSLLSLPGAEVLLEALRIWWPQHPMRSAALLVGHSALALVRPVARNHPLGLVLAAFLAGAVLTWSRPWRWALKPVLLAGLLPQLLMSILARQARQAPTVTTNIPRLR
jgi:hypothetical protein